MIYSLIGHYSLILGLIVGLVLFYLSFKNFKNSNFLNPKILTFTFLQFFFVVISFLCLIISFIKSDFSNETVFNNSHTTKPLFYKISGTWGNHEGSLLLWLLVLTLFIFIFLLKTKNQSNKYKILTLFFQQIIILGFFIFLIKTSNPFNYLFPIPEEGLGLNPILQDPALAIHPPILYLGYVGSSIIFSSVLAATSLKIISMSWASHIKNWILISWIFLTLGILLGSIWAYYELGWGGFWFWDPVENVSLMPWLALTTLLHCILVLEKKTFLTSWVIILSIATFTLSMCGTFLVRSGILNSVHTFANDPTRGVFILSFLFLLIFLSLIIFFFFNKENQKDNSKVYFLSKEVSVLINNWFLMYFLSVVLIGTVYPIFLEVISDNKISVGPPFYNKLIIPLLIFFLVFMSIGPNFKWIRETNINNKFQLIILFLASLFLSYFLFYKFGQSSLTNILLLSASLYLFFVTIKDFFSKNLYNFSKKIAHFGFSLLILSIVLNAILSKEVTANLRVGDKIDFENAQISFSSIKSIKKENYQSIVGSFTIEDKRKIYEFNPELRIYDQPIIITSEADIKVSLFEDKFLVMNTIKGEEYFNVRYQIKPFMIWIWFSVILISFSALVNLFKKKYEN